MDFFAAFFAGAAFAAGLCAWSDFAATFATGTVFPFAFAVALLPSPEVLAETFAATALTVDFAAGFA